MGMHGKPFHLSEESMDRLPYELYLALQERMIPEDSFVVVLPGKYVNW